MIEHATLVSVESNGDAYFHGPHGATYHYTLTQLRTFADFDRELRKHGIYQIDEHPIPGGYAEFQAIWASDPGNRFQFSTYDATTGIKDVRGKAVPIDQFAPLPRFFRTTSEYHKFLVDGAAKLALAEKIRRSQLGTVDFLRRERRRKAAPAELGEYRSPYIPQVSPGPSCSPSVGPARSSSLNRSSRMASRSSSPYAAAYGGARTRVPTPPSLVAAREAVGPQMEPQVSEGASNIILDESEDMVVTQDENTAESTA
ncbi:hypothetical protein OBBRIDRAFT_807877 [Obba rivulosa]|uniref:Uncharacterized protein n=1 Tax=Obba rivulosa TaxID=1052685 RepID=A0A8E2ATG6_9APHY|nr:hypothetical protein OBBRIDRAFT_807877 [Obba rivulosa]